MYPLTPFLFFFLLHVVSAQFPAIPDCLSPCFDGTDVHTCALVSFSCICEPASRPTFKSCLSSACGNDATGLRQADSYRTGFCAITDSSSVGSSSSSSTSASSRARQTPTSASAGEVVSARGGSGGGSVGGGVTVSAPGAPRTSSDTRPSFNSGFAKATGASQVSADEKVVSSGDTASETASNGSSEPSASSPSKQDSKSSDPSATTTSSGVSNSKSGLSTGAKIGIGVGVPLAFVVIGVLLYLAYLFGRRRRNDDSHTSAGDEKKSDVPELPDAPVPPVAYELPAARPRETHARHTVVQELPGAPIRETMVGQENNGLGREQETVAVPGRGYYESAVAVEQPVQTGAPAVESTGQSNTALRHETSEIPPGRNWR